MLIIIILVEREWSDKFIISSRRIFDSLRAVPDSFDISLEIQHELAREKQYITKQFGPNLCTFCIDEYLLRFNIHFSHVLFTHR
jgi:hypothetical protein